MEQLTKTHLRKSMPSFSLMGVCKQGSDVFLTDTELFELRLVTKRVRNECYSYVCCGCTKHTVKKSVY